MSTNCYSVSQNEAVRLAKNAVLYLGNGDTRAGSGRTLVLESVVRYPKATRSVDGNEPFFYIVNFEDGGYAVVSSDKRATCIYAVSDEGRFDPEANDGVKLFMSLAENCLSGEVFNRDSLNHPIEGPTFDGDNPFLRDDNMIINVGGEEQQLKVSTTTTEPFYLLETEWGQDFPYNLECYTDKGERAVTGCVATALAQIMAYHKQPQQYNGHQYYWDRMPFNVFDYDYSSEAYSVAYLMNDIGNAVSMKYGTDLSTAYSSKCKEALKKFGYTSTDLVKFNQDGITTSLDLKRPVYISGSEPGASLGHAWVIDGYFYVRYDLSYYSADGRSLIGSDTEMNYYFHMNWGWNGQSISGEDDDRADGFFYSGVYEHGRYGEGEGYGFQYTEDIKMLSQIRYNV